MLSWYFSKMLLVPRHWANRPILNSHRPCQNLYVWAKNCVTWNYALIATLVLHHSSCILLLTVALPLIFHGIHWPILMLNVLWDWLLLGVVRLLGGGCRLLVYLLLLWLLLLLLWWWLWLWLWSVVLRLLRHNLWCTGHPWHAWTTYTHRLH